MNERPVLDAENEGEATAFSLEDTQSYFELGRRIRNTAALALAIAFPCAVIIIGWKILSA